MEGGRQGGRRENDGRVRGRRGGSRNQNDPLLRQQGREESQASVREGEPSREGGPEGQGSAIGSDLLLRTRRRHRQAGGVLRRRAGGVAPQIVRLQQVIVPPLERFTSGWRTRWWDGVPLQLVGRSATPSYLGVRNLIGKRSRPLHSVDWGERLDRRCPGHRLSIRSEE